MQKVEMIYDGDQPERVIKNDAGRKQLPYVEAFKFDDKTPKGQLATINGWNAMRQRLLEIGEMENK